jgi:tripartite-type tricarboxylate transporter receptor subunit TctC
MLRRSILASLLASPSLAQTPERSVRLIIAFPPGGSTDILGRLIAPRMGEVLGAVVTPENRSGASGAVGAGFVAQAAPDGGTFLLDSGGQSVNPFLMRGLGFDYVRDLTPVTLLTTLPLILITGGSDGGVAAWGCAFRLYLIGAGGTFDPRGSGARHRPFRAHPQYGLPGAADHQ